MLSVSSCNQKHDTLRKEGCSRVLELCQSIRVTFHISHFSEDVIPGASRQTPCVQDGYAVVSSDGPGDYDVAFEVFAGTAQAELQAGTVAYIGTGTTLTPSMIGVCFFWGSAAWIISLIP